MAKIIVAARQSSGNLNFRVAQVMIHKLLTCERIKTALDEGRIINHASNNKPEVKIGAFTKEELAGKLGISTKELDKLKRPNFYKDMASKISLPLICLYCATKFADGEYKC
ncbi:MAG: hypothetical protein WCH10_02555 [bacterium]